LKNIATVKDVVLVQSGNDLYITSQADLGDNGEYDSGVLLVGWFAGGNSIESFATADNVAFTF
jgi:hypothetical protein